MLSLRRLVPLSVASCLALAAPLSALPSAAFAQALAVSITLAPPPLPIYAQPVIPGPGYIWTPGYWAWGPYGYYWVPGTWVLPPAIGLLWTPGYWAWVDGAYLWHAGYWGPAVGFYGGINYGFGYPGVGYFGGRWDHGHFFYNRAVNNFGGRHIANFYNAPVRVTNHTHVSFNGGRGGVQAGPTGAEQAAAQHHTDPTPLQLRHEHAASGNHALRASVNHGRPAIAATPRPANFTGSGVVRARGAPVHTAAAHPAPRPAPKQAAPQAHPPEQHPAEGDGGDEHEHH